MEESKKKPIMIAVMLGCIVLAIGITIMTRSGETGGDTIEKGAKLWVKCGNDTCSAEYQRNKRDYYAKIKERQNPMEKGVSPEICKECNEESIFEARKCAKCGEVFFLEAAGGKFPDECPDCGYSPRRDGR